MGRLNPEAREGSGPSCPLHPGDSRGHLREQRLRGALLQGQEAGRQGEGCSPGAQLSLLSGGVHEEKTGGRGVGRTQSQGSRAAVGVLLCHCPQFILIASCDDTQGLREVPGQTVEKLLGASLWAGSAGELGKLGQDALREGWALWGPMSYLWASAVLWSGASELFPSCPSCFHDISEQSASSHRPPNPFPRLTWWQILLALPPNGLKINPLPPTPLPPPGLAPSSWCYLLNGH